MDNQVLFIFGIVICVVFDILAIGLPIFIVIMISRRREIKKSEEVQPIKEVVRSEVERKPIVSNPVARKKPIGGATQKLLKRIHEDFPEYHAQDAENAIKTFIMEYINICFGHQKEFEKSRTTEKTKLNIDKKATGYIKDIVFNGIAIYKYDKSIDYATVTYQCSVGFDFYRERVEKKYEIEYTLHLVRDDIPMKVLRCPECGGEYNSTRDKFCPYCGSEIIKDTILNWYITEITELD